MSHILFNFLKGNGGRERRKEKEITTKEKKREKKRKEKILDKRRINQRNGSERISSNAVSH